jgi:hypothetical protein
MARGPSHGFELIHKRGRSDETSNSRAHMHFYPEQYSFVSLKRVMADLYGFNLVLPWYVAGRGHNVFRASLVLSLLKLFFLSFLFSSQLVSWEQGLWSSTQPLSLVGSTLVDTLFISSLISLLQTFGSSCFNSSPFGPNLVLVSC